MKLSANNDNKGAGEVAQRLKALAAALAEDRGQFSVPMSAAHNCL